MAKDTDGVNEDSVTSEKEIKGVAGTYVSDPEMAKLLARPAAEAWVPNTGDSIGGIVVDVTSGTSEYGDYPIIEIDTGKGCFTLHCFHETLQNEVERRDIHVGDGLGVSYLGEIPSKVRGHNPYKKFRVFHRIMGR